MVKNGEVHPKRTSMLKVFTSAFDPFTDMRALPLLLCRTHDLSLYPSSRFANLIAC